MLARPVLAQVVLSVGEARLLLEHLRAPLPIDVAHGRTRRPSALGDALEDAIAHIDRYQASTP